MWKCNNCEFINNDDSAGPCVICGNRRLSVRDEINPIPPRSGKIPIVVLFLAVMIIVLVALPQRANANGLLSTGNPAIQVYAGNNYNLSAYAEGSVLATGGEYGEAQISADIATWTNMIDIEVSDPDGYSFYSEDVFAVGLRKDGTVAFAGDPSNANSFELMNELKNWTNIVQISTGCVHVVGLRKDGTVVKAGENNSGQSNL